MNVTTGQVIAERISRSNSATFTAFLSMLHQMVPRHLRIHLICDNGSSHTSAATWAWLAAHPRFSVTYAPRDDLDAEITALTIRHNKNARTNGITTPTPNTPATWPGTPRPAPRPWQPREHHAQLPRTLEDL
jgi:hypothetical protein